MAAHELLSVSTLRLSSCGRSEIIIKETTLPNHALPRYHMQLSAWAYITGEDRRRTRGMVDVGLGTCSDTIKIL